MDLTDEQWSLIEPLLPARKLKRKDRPGRTPTPSRALWDGILWILRTGAQWSELPREKYPPYKTVHLRFQGWVRDGTFRAALRALALDLKERGGFDLEEGFVDAYFASAKKGGPASGKPKRGKGTKVMAAADGAGLPLAIGAASASPHETKLLEATLDESLIDELPERLIGDKAYDADKLDERLWHQRGVKLIAPHRRGRKTKTQDGRELRRYRRRWKMERLFAWLQNFRRLVTRYEVKVENFLGFLHLGCILILLRQF
ncbi:IS5 family transposase [Myxococcus sp. AB036A]|uniref:IS5 family transposase n=1 Tax=Myxococcus sp. AB036A TaxID=2562793 RepID=UPI001E4DB245|nr:IS5 family transposase [Myxococcus sp. AB036A]